METLISKHGYTIQFNGNSTYIVIDSNNDSHGHFSTENSKSAQILYMASLEEARTEKKVNELRAKINEWLETLRS